MKRTIYLHVGPHKTGTTVIQKACLDNQHILEENGVSYPKMYFNHIGHHGLVNTVRRRDIADNDVQIFKDIERDILLSSENFIHFTAKDWAYLRDKLKSDFNFCIIYAWRRSSLKMYSIWQESVKHGSSATFQNFFYKDLVRPVGSKVLSQILTLDMLSDIFGRESLRVLDYDSLLSKGEVVDAFFSLVGVVPGSIDISNQSNGVKNASLDPETTEVLRCLNALSKQHGYPESSHMRESFFLRSDLVLEKVIQLKELMKNSREVMEVGNYFVDLRNEKLICEKYSDLIVSYENNKKVKNITTVNSDWTLNPKSVALLQEIYAKVS
ncbi:hypothetical protein ACPV5S_19480 [Vibrio astriarenae]